MRLPDGLPAQAIHQVVERELGAQINEEPWNCDVIWTHADLIEQHNRLGIKNGHQTESKFAGVRHEKRRLEDLLREDHEYLCRGSQPLRDIRQHLILVEVSKPFPNTNNITIEHNGKQFHLICFGSQLLYFIHSSFSKIDVLVNDFRHANCLPEHDSILEGPTYSDTNLLAGLFNDIEILFDQQRIFLPMNPPHLASPYEYCEIVEGTRRFLLAHELGHALFDNSRIKDDAPCRFLPDSLPIEQRIQWDEEYWCDTFAARAILDIYKNVPLEGPPLYECESALMGMMQYFTLMELVELPLREQNAIPFNHPPHRFRKEIVRSVIKAHPVYVTSKQLQKVLDRNWKRLNSFRSFAGGVTAPLALTTVWSFPDFLERLSAFGRTAYNSIGKQVHWEWLNLYDMDIDQVNAYEVEF